MTLVPAGAADSDGQVPRRGPWRGGSRPMAHGRARRRPSRLVAGQQGLGIGEPDQVVRPYGDHRGAGHCAASASRTALEASRIFLACAESRRLDRSVGPERARVTASAMAPAHRAHVVVGGVVGVVDGEQAVAEAEGGPLAGRRRTAAGSTCRELVELVDGAQGDPCGGCLVHGVDLHAWVVEGQDLRGLQSVRQESAG